MDLPKAQDQLNPQYHDVLLLGSESEQQPNTFKSSHSYRCITSFEELDVEVCQQLKNKYAPVSLLYEGDSSVILTAVDLNSAANSSHVCLKISKTAAREAEVYGSLSQGDHVAHCISHGLDYLVMRIYEGSLAQILASADFFDARFIAKMLRDCCLALRSLHSRHIIHSDIKPGNILWRRGVDLGFYLADFGSSILQHELELINMRKSAQRQVQTLCKQTWPYRAPEWHQAGITISNKVDSWGLGCVLFECLTGQSLLPAQVCMQKQYNLSLAEFAGSQAIAKRMRRFSSPTNMNIFGKLTLALLSAEPSQRPDSQQILAMLHQVSLSSREQVQ